MELDVICQPSTGTDFRISRTVFLLDIASTALADVLHAAKARGLKPGDFVEVLYNESADAKKHRAHLEEMLVNMRKTITIYRQIIIDHGLISEISDE